MHQKNFMDIKPFTLLQALKVSYSFMSRKYFTAKKPTRKHRK